MPNLKYTMTPKTISCLVTPILLAINIGWIVLAVLNHSMAARLTKEDNIIQWFQFFFLLGTAFYCLRIVLGEGLFYKGKTVKYGFLVFLLLTMVVAFEEISWGQRIFGIATPDFIKQVNVQNEITLHNLSCLQRYRHWLLILFGCTGLILIYLKTYVDKIDVQLSFFSPSVFFKTAFILVLISGVAREAAYIFLSLFPGNMANAFRYWAGRYSEIGELNVSIAAFFYAFYKFNSILSRNHIVCRDAYSVVEQTRKNLTII